MDYTDFLVDRAQHMRPLEYDLSNNFNMLVRYLHDMGVLDNLPVATLGPAAILSASDALAAPLRSLVVGGNSTQDGTPTPDAPVAIKSVVDPVVTFAGKNLFDATTWIEDGRIPSADTGALAPSTVSHRSALMHLNVGTYTYSLVNSRANGPKYVHAYDSNGAWLRMLTSRIAGDIGTTFSVSFEVASDVAYVCIVSQIADTNVQLELGSTATAYEPYEGTTVTLPVTLRSLPDGTKDSLTLTYLRPSTREGWAVYSASITQRIATTTLTGASGESWTRMATDMSGKYRYRATISGIASGEDIPSASVDGCILSPTFANIPDSGSNGTYNCVNGMNLRRTSTREVTFYYNGADDSALTYWRSWVASHNIDITYKLATPITTQLDPIELPSVIGPSCTIYATADATPQLTAEYVRDLSSTINDMQEAIADI